MQKRTFNKFLVLTTIACTAFQLSGCGGGGGGSVTTNTPSLSADQIAFESMYLSPSSSFNSFWSLTLSGTPVNGTNFFYAHPTTLLLSPLTSGPQKPFFSTNSSLANTLSIPSTSINTRYLLAGQVVIDASTIERFSYQGSSIKDETLTSNGTLIFSSLRSGVTSTPLSGLVINSQPDFAHWFNALFSNSSLLISTATWGVGSAYLKYTATNIADRYRVLDFSTATTGSVPSPVATGTTIGALMATGGIASSSDAVTYTMSNGSVHVINGVTTYIASIPRPNSTSNLFRTYYEIGGNVLIGDLLRAGEVIGGTAYQTTSNGVTVANFDGKYQIRINQAAFNSIKAAVTF